jgi:hypothetical protein
MKRTILTAVIASLLVATGAPAFAGSSQGSAARLPIGVEGTGGKPETYGTSYAAPMPVKRDPDGIVPLGEGVVPQTGWNPFGTVQLTASELAAQQAVNRAWNRQLRDQFNAKDGCQGDFLSPFEAAWCWNRDSRGTPLVTGQPQVGTGWGGSDN